MSAEGRFCDGNERRVKWQGVRLQQIVLGEATARRLTLEVARLEVCAGLELRNQRVNLTESSGMLLKPFFCSCISAGY